jgi:hypothetical protein
MLPEDGADRPVSPCVAENLIGKPIAFFASLVEAEGEDLTLIWSRRRIAE